MIATIATIAVIAAIAAIAGKCFPYDRYDRCDHWPCFFFSDHSDHNDHMETRLYRWRFFSLLLLVILEKWMIYRFRPSQKVWTKFRQNLHQSYFVCLFFFSCNQFKLRQKAQKLFIQENSEDCQAQPKQNTAFIKPNWRRNTKSKAF